MILVMNMTTLIFRAIATIMTMVTIMVTIEMLIVMMIQSGMR